MRGGAVAIVAVLVGAWALGLAEAGDEDKSPPPNVVKPVDPGDSPTYDIRRSKSVEKSDAPRTRQPDPTQQAVVESIVDTADDPTPDSVDPTPDSVDPTPDAPDPGWDPQDPSTPPPPSNPPSNPPNEPEEECTDLVSVLNCVLDPITGQP